MERRVLTPLLVFVNSDIMNLGASGGPRRSSLRRVLRKAPLHSHDYHTFYITPPPFVVVQYIFIGFG